MREIKFRAWGKFTKSWIDVYIQKDNVVFSIIPRNKSGHVITAEDLVFCQYTGLKDKNDVEIYEGDILKTPDRLVSVYWNELGIWDSKYVKLTGRTSSKGGIMRNEWKDCEVIGNIYENKELLK